MFIKLDKRFFGLRELTVAKKYSKRDGKYLQSLQSS